MAQIYVDRGLELGLAREVARQLMAKDALAVKIDGTLRDLKFEVGDGKGDNQEIVLVVGGASPAALRPPPDARLVDWVAKGTPPPPSQYPRLDRGELVVPRQVAMGFPVIAGVPFPDGLLNPFYDYDFGPQFNYRDLSGVITMQPPPIRQILPTVVPKVDADGNEMVGVASVLHQVPLGTYTGWNTVATGFYKGHIRTNTGAYIPFARTKADRMASGDPRPSLEERSGSHERYVGQVRAAAERLVRGGDLLKDDADRLIAQAEASKVLK